MQTFARKFFKKLRKKVTVKIGSKKALTSFAGFFRNQAVTRADFTPVDRYGRQNKCNQKISFLRVNYFNLKNSFMKLLMFSLSCNQFISTYRMRISNLDSFLDKTEIVSEAYSEPPRSSFSRK